MLIRTATDVPSPRGGHASIIIGMDLIVWGGNTSAGPELIQQGDKDDNRLYLLDLQSKNWTCIAANGPIGQYGHTMTMVQKIKFVVFGGQANEEFFNDLWSFDLLRRKWELIEPISPGKPAQQAGHVCINYKDHIVIFGGADRQYHYNDTWSFDLITRKWSELICAGCIPAPREGHAAALVDDDMYVLSGRGANGKDLNDLAAFKLSNQQWYTFPYIGPAPSARAGHAMASFGARVFVLGGESFTPTEPVEVNCMHILDTSVYL
ncbi:galactose oxidase [Gymnopus androsaceus JB14]|uniref:Galactose oxidase n=1 Tax=Gymnopus androsaceus JB14 TaxID=1447944 RepID=A0A6A4I0X3_9AGAR|nr:galactose oxidase [Gymnopus androsaceus JB14]